jgi:dipeptidyl aminopeptidase/acylaminoacyl peptidase
VLVNVRKLAIHEWAIRVGLALAGLTCAGTLGAEPAAAAARLFEGRDLFALQYASDPQIRPDGAAVAYVRVTHEVMSDSARRSIWLVDVDSGQQVPVVSGNGSYSSPRWSPDGKRLAYIANDGGRSQLYVRWMASGQATRLTELTAAPGDLSWSPDGQSIAFTMFAPDEKPSLGTAPPKPEGANWAPALEVITDIVYRTDGAGYLKPGYTHVYLVAAEGGAPRQLSFGSYNEAGPVAWSPDGRYVLVAGNRLEGWRRDPVNTEIYRIAVLDGRITPLTQRVGPDSSPQVSPDGSRIAYLGFDDRLLGFHTTRVHSMDREGKDIKVLSETLDRSVEDLYWAADGRSLYIQYDDEGSTRIARLLLDGKRELIAEGVAGGALDRPYTGGQFTVAANGAVAFTSGSPLRPADISVTYRGRTRQLTRLNEALLGGKDLGAVSALPVKSSLDGRAVGAWLVKPAQFVAGKKYPLILEIHGGPFAAYGPVFSTDNQLYAAAGYAVLYTNPRGSTSYGEEFANLIHHDYPNHDYDDLMSAVDTAIATGFVDPDNLFVTGGSGGGVLTAWIVGKNNRFRAAATQKPVINWASTVLTTDLATYMPKYWFDKMPWEDPQGYWRRSPLSLVGSVNTPTLVVVGDQDFRTPLSDSEQYYQALQLRGVPTALVKVPGASHGGLTARPSQSAAKASAILAWFQRYRKGAVAVAKD